MVPNSFAVSSAVRDFQDARIKAALQAIISHFTGKSNRLLSYDEVAKKLKLHGRTDRGVRPIPVNAIIGSVSRYTDFSRTFLPLQKQDEQRWAMVKASSAEGSMPPIEVYKVGEVYFVLDGNHRVSIARQEGMEQIDASVIEIQTAVPLTPDIQPEDLIIKAEYAGFLQDTGLAELRPNVDISITIPGQYRKLSQQIEAQAYLLEQEQERAFTHQEAVLSWYDDVYLPMVSAIEESGLLHLISGRTPADIYLWVSEHRAALEEELGWVIRSDSAVADLLVKNGGKSDHREGKLGAWRKSRMVARYTEHLFKDLLVPLAGTDEGWDALEQGLAVAAREDARLDALHIVGPDDRTDPSTIDAIRDRFLQTCENAGVSGRFVVENGEVVDKICQRALLTDMVVLNGAHPPADGMGALGSRLRAIIWRSPRPVLAVCCNISPMDRTLLAFDGSPRSKEALFAATYVAEQWLSSLTVLAVTGGSRVKPSVLDYARAYLDLHEIEADYLAEEGAIDTLHRILDERSINFLVMGGYSFPALGDLIRESAVNFMLREMHCPMLICR